jgi:protein-tyrosine phosphatase
VSGGGAQTEAALPRARPAAPASDQPPARGLRRWANQVERRFGGKRGLALHLLALLQMSVPWRRGVREIDWSRVERVVFVCKGNICRSPYAAAKALALGLPAVSAGLEATRDAPADKAACAQADCRGISLAAHRTARFEDLTGSAGDLVICMEPGQLRHIRASRSGFPAQMTLLGLWAQPPRPFIFDPYGLSGDYWKTCFDVIDDAVARIGSAWREHRGRPGPNPDNRLLAPLAAQHPRERL